MTRRDFLKMCTRLNHLVGGGEYPFQGAGRSLGERKYREREFYFFVQQGNHLGIGGECPFTIYGGGEISRGGKGLPRLDIPGEKAK